ncbi:MAG: flagellar motor protein MotB [Spongiibacteraceae bacterium]|jgi:chemotaxis protein MotB|nr:flagellar motor protein MotB [Spongiibacteraceae bacterium]
MANSNQPIIIKKKKAARHQAHSTAWKVAFADFMTAMMAFFLLMWLLGNTTDEQKRAISGYFQDPGGSRLGSGGANPGLIDLGVPMTQSEPVISSPPTPAQAQQSTGAAAESLAPQPEPYISDARLAEAYLRQEQAALEELRRKLEDELERANSALRQLRDQIIIEQTELGLRITIVDKESRPMFDLGSSHLKIYSEQVLHALGPLIDTVPNPVSITGHTDAVPFGSSVFYTNWELSSDRANTARRALLDGGYPERKVLTVQGMGSAAPLKPEEPEDPMNRRIAIIVLKQSVAEALAGRIGLGSNRVIETEGAALRGEPAPRAESTATDAPLPPVE